MDELIKVTHERIGTEAVQTVNARELYVFLEVGKDFTNWIKVQIERARLVKNRDFVVSAQKGVNPGGGRPTAEYHLTIDAGKHVAMMSGTDKGFAVRDYFIECERQAKSISQFHIPQTLPEALRLAADLADKNKILLVENSKLAPKAAAHDLLTLSDGSMCLTNAAKVLEMQPKAFFHSLHNLHWIYRRTNSTVWVAHQDKIRSGCLMVKTFTMENTDGTSRTREQTLITPKGLARLAGILSEARQLHIVNV